MKAITADITNFLDIARVLTGLRVDVQLEDALMVVAEAYPDLKASASYLELQQRISGLEEQIAHRREYYNSAVNVNNVRMEQFPDMLLTGLQPKT